MPSESFYFPHDYDASSDIKMVALLNKYGATGVGIYWMLVEMLHKEESSCIHIDEDHLPLLAGNMRLEEDMLRAVIADCATKFKLFTLNGNCITSVRVQNNKERRNQIRQSRSVAGRRGAEITNSLKSANADKNPANAGDIPANGRQNPAKSSKGKESKGKESKEDGSTGAAHRFTHNGFFDRQLAANQGEPELDKYQRLVEYLHEQDEEGKYKFANILTLPKQMSFRDYLELKKVERESQGRTLKQILENMENKKSLAREYSNVYLTAKNWLRQNYKQA